MTGARTSTGGALGSCLAVALSLGAGSAVAQAVPDTRAQEMASCLPGEIVTWPDGQDRPAPGGAVRLVYRHGGAPAWFDEALVLGVVQRAAAAWASCGVPAEVIGETAALIDPGRVTVVQWNDAHTRGNFALADLGNRTLSLSPALFRLLAERHPRRPAAQTLQMAVSHEMGHFFGLMAHSRRCIDVMSYYTNASGEACSTRDGGSHHLGGGVDYRAVLPTACDIARCRAVNGTAR